MDSSRLINLPEDVYWYYESDRGTTWGGGRTIHAPKTHYLVKNLERIDCVNKKDALQKMKELNNKLKEHTMLDRALKIAVDAHSGQKDKGGQPYILHPLRIMMQMESEAEKVAAILHDVVEDTHIMFNDLEKEGIIGEALQAVILLTKNPGQNYFEVIEKITQNNIARKVKIKDLEDNMMVWRLMNMRDLQPQDLKRIRKYAKAWSILTGR